MAKLQNPFKNTRFVLQPGSRKLKLALTGVIVCGMAALIALGAVIYSIRLQTQEKLNEAAELEYENSQLQEKIEGIGSAQSAEEIAQEELGMADPDTVIIAPKN